MVYEKTAESLNNRLLEDGFRPYSSMPNKYWNADGRIVWTDGNFYQDRADHEWVKYTNDDLLLKDNSTF